MARRVEKIKILLVHLDNVKQRTSIRTAPGCTTMRPRLRWLPHLNGGFPTMSDEAQKVRMVKCVKLGKELPGLDRVPWKGEIGKRVYESVSKDAWKMWVDHSKMLLNEFRLNPMDPNSQKIMEEQMEQFFFGDGSKPPEGFVVPKH
jgi:Fe-S cluster biosynthesis and repair protein YggX